MKKKLEKKTLTEIIENDVKVLHHKYNPDCADCRRERRLKRILSSSIRDLLAKLAKEYNRENPE